MIFRCSSQTALLEEAAINPSQSLDAEGIPGNSDQQRPTSQTNPKSKSKMVKDSFGLQANRGVPMPTRTVGTQPDSHSEFSRDVTQISYHLHRGESSKALRYSRVFVFVFSYHWGKLLKKNPAENTEQKNLSRFPTVIEPCVTYPLLTASFSFQGCFLQEKSEGSCLKKLN